MCGHGGGQNGHRGGDLRFSGFGAPLLGLVLGEPGLGLPALEVDVFADFLVLDQGVQQKRLHGVRIIKIQFRH